MWVRLSCSAVVSQLRTPLRCTTTRSMANVCSDAPVVQVAQGTLRGRRAISKSGGRFLSFQGIPYARPPVGALRFEPPEPPEPWTGVRDAVQEGAVCPHRDWIQGLGFQGDEDCLFLNVYTLELLHEGMKKNQPVMVWIHGGGYYIGSGNTDMYGPDYLVEAGVVVVTLNYRLGALGFFSLEDESYPGNIGLRDQVAALIWVKNNITQFGGDPSNVTLFGESAGGSCVQFHMMSPMSRGLFHKAIAQSGSIFNPWAMASSSLRKRAFKLGEVLGCSTSDSEELVKFLKTISPKELVEGSAKTITKEEKRRGDVLSFNPIPENGIGKNPFLPGHPEELLSTGKYSDIPFMAGVTSHEGILDLTAVIKHPPLASIFDKDFERFVPFNLSEPPEQSQEIAEQIKKFYFGDKLISMDTLEELGHVYSDLNFVCGMNKLVDLLSLKSKSPLYFYKFSYDGDLGVFKKFINASYLPGVSHMDDLGYLFLVEALDEDEDPKEQDMSMIRKMVKMWTNFAKSGNPTSQLDSDVNVQWVPFTKDNPVYLNIDVDLIMEKRMFKERVAFWNQLYKRYNK